MPSVKIQGAEHRYTLTPRTNAPYTIAFLHGWLLSQAYWQPLVEQLQPHYQCLTYDLRGFGQSQLGDRNEYSPASYAQDLLEMLDILGIQNVWLVGHSLGGIIALWSARVLGDRVLGVVCLNAGGGIYIKEEFEKFRQAGRVILKFRPLWLQNIPFVDRQFAKDSVKFSLDRQWGKQRALDFVTAKYEAAQGTLLDSTSAEEVLRLPQVVASLKQPAYFIAGSDDQIMEPKYVRHLASFHASFNGCGDNVFELTDCGHMLMLEQTEQVTEILRDLLIYNRVEQVIK
ncbi:alpha/beta hydrolase [Tumidithrix helvetica PCC 7403]|uniref:alpha/beta fold hydrolase n=1 Tax=Tumidithrix helvetica TaxID=3457545 RepID=UPI003C9AE7D3